MLLSIAFKSVVVIVYVFVPCLLAQSQSNCTYFSKTYNTLYNFWPLYNPSGFYKMETDEFTFYVNLCGPVTSSPCQSTCSGCQTWSNGQAELGTASTLVLSQSDETGLIASYTEGLFGRQMKIRLSCYPSAGVGSPYFVTENTTDETYYFEWPTSYACPHDICDREAECSDCLLVNQNASLANTCAFCLEGAGCVPASMAWISCSNIVVEAQYCPAAASSSTTSSDEGQFSAAEMGISFVIGFVGCAVLAIAIAGAVYYYKKKNNNQAGYSTLSGQP